MVAAWLAAILFIAITSQARGDEPLPAAFDDLAHAKDWREAAAASKALSELGEAALPSLLVGAKHQSGLVRRHCMEILVEKFPTNAAAIDAIVLAILLKSDDRDDQAIRYRCAFSAGSYKITRAADALREVYQAGGELKLTAAKSLAELGDTTGFVTLYDALSSEWYMERYQANVGLKALTGRDVTDFDHDWREGAFVTGGKELRRLGRQAADAQTKSDRYAAIARLHRWLDDEKPEFAELLDPQSKSAREKARKRKESAEEQ